MVCAATAAPVTVDALGTQEQVGDILLICENIPPRFGGDPSLNSVVANISMWLNVNVTNDTRPGASGVMTDAVLIVNDNDCPTPSDAGSTFGSCGAPNPDFQDPQFGTLGAVNGVEWSAVVMPVPGSSKTGEPVADCGASPGACYPDVITYRIAGIEANALQLGLPSGLPRHITAFLSVTASTTVPVTNNVLHVANTTIGGLARPSDPDLVSGVECTTAATPYPADPTGPDEPLGDVLISCSNNKAVPAGSSVTLDLGLALNTDFTNGPETGPPVLVINRNDCPSPAADGSTFGGCGALDATVQDPQLGDVDQTQRVVWRNVTFPVPPANGERTTLLIRGLRGDVATLMAGGATFPSTQATAFVMLALPMSGSVFNVGVPLGAPSPPSEANVGYNSCQATAVPPVVRAEGIAELLGDIVIVCQNLGGVGPETVVDFFVTLNVDVTNNIGFGPGADVTDAVLIVNENNCAAPVANGGVYDSCGAPDPDVQDPQFAVLEAPNRLAWRGVHVPTAGNPEVTTLRISGMRGRTSHLGIPSHATFPSTQVTAFLAMSRSSFISNNVLNVAVPILGGIGSWSQQTASQCQGTSINLPVTLTEGFATSFRDQGQASFQPGNAATESGYFAPGSNNGGGASQGTRIGLFLAGIPSGVRLKLPKRIQVEPAPGSFLTLQWVSGADVTGAGGMVSSATDDVIVDSPPGGTASIFYEVVENDPFSIQSIVVPVTASWSAGAAAAGTIQLQAILAPVSDVLQASFPAAEPRFEVHGSASPLLTIEACAPGAFASVGVFRPSNGALFLKSQNATGFADAVLTYGLPGDKPVAGDWDGDGVDTIGVFRGGTFFLRNSNSNGFADIVVAYGLPGDLPVVGDWDGDGVDTIGVFRNGLFLLRNTNDSGPAEMAFGLGLAGDAPIAGDWDGDDVDTVGVFRPSNGALFLKNQNSTGFADLVLTYGIPGDKPVTGDWNGDGIDTIGVYRGGDFLLRDSNTNGFANYVFTLGVSGDEPIAGSWGPLP